VTLVDADSFPALRALFLRCFVDGHADPAARPAAGEWREALAFAGDALLPCARNPQHLLGAHLRFCPWCERTRLLRGRDPFPATVAAARAKPPASPRASAAAFAPPAPVAPKLSILPPRSRSYRAGRLTRTVLVGVGAFEPAGWVLEHYPPHIRDRGIAGSADVRFQVLEDGAVNSRTIRVESSTRPGFELAALEVAPKLRFHPATQRGRPVAATLVMTIDFRLDP
jgi:TonB family protein